MVDAKSVRTKRVRNLVAALLIVITAFGAYFFLYTQRRERQVTAHNLRLLATTADYMGDALLGCAGSIRLALMEAETPDSAAIAKKLELIKGLARRSGGDLTTTQLDSLTKAEVVPRLEFKNLQWGVDGQIAIALEGYNGESQLVFMPARTRPGNLSAGAWRLLLRDVVEPIAPLDVFDEVVLARADGDVLLEAGRGSLRVENLVLNAQRSKDDQSAPEGGVGSRVWDADFGDQTQRLYLQPVRLPIPINVAMTGGKLAPEDHWVVVGIMPKARARSLSMSIPPNAILGTVAILALGLLLLPLIKIRFMGAREELRQVDVVAMLVATVLTVSVATHCILFACAQHWEACRVDGELNNLAMQINWQLRRELRGLNNELARQTRGVRPEGLKQNILADSTVTASDPFFEQVFFMNSRGWQKAKWTTHKSNTPVSNLAERRYFDEAYHGRLWQFLEEDTTDARPRRGAGFEKDEPDTMFTPGCYVESIRSRTTGRETAILSRRYHELQKPDSVIVAAIESRLRSVMNPVLPLGYGFAIMDESGAVQFHSDPTRNVRENFFEELDPALPLQRAVRAREKAFTRATYRTVQSVVYVRPITSTPWVLAVFYDWHSTELWLLEVSVYSLSLFIAVLLVGALLTIVTHLGLVRLSKRNRRRPGEAHAVWFWIRDAHRARYRRVLVASVSFIVVWALLCRHATGKAFIIVSMLLPALAYASLFLTLREPSTESATVPPPLERRPSRSTIRYYGAMIFALIIIGGSLPAAYSFRVIQREETVMAMQDRQLALMKSVAARRTALVKAYANVALSDTARTALISELEPRVVADRDGSSMTGEDSARDADSLGARTASGRAGRRFHPRTLGIYIPPQWRWEDSTAGVPPVEKVSQRHGKGAHRDSTEEAGQEEASDDMPPSLHPVIDAMRSELQSVGLATGRTQCLNQWQDNWDKRDDERIAKQQTSWWQERAGHTDRGGARNDDKNRNGSGSGRWQVHADWFLHIRAHEATAAEPVFKAANKRFDVKKSNFPTLCMNAPIPSFRPVVGHNFWLLVVPAFVLLWLMIRTSMQYAFLIGLDRPSMLDGTEFVDGRANRALPSAQVRHAILLRSHLKGMLGEDERARFEKDYSVITHAQIVHAEKIDTLLADLKGKVVVANFDYGLRDHAIAERKLDLLERLNESKPLNVYIESSVDPLYFLTELASDPGIAPKDAPKSMDRWAVALQRYMRVRHQPCYPLPDELTEKVPVEVRETLTEETWATPQLHKIGLRLAVQENIRTLSRRDVVDCILDLAQAHYRRVWNNCSTDEKMLLFRIAEEGFVNRAGQGTLRSLVRRQLVVMDPNCRIVNESFRLFILSAERPETFAKWQADAGESLWSRLKWPVAMAITAISVFFVATQRELFNQWIAVLAAVTAGAPAIFRLVGMVGQAKRPDSEK